MLEIKRSDESSLANVPVEVDPPSSLLVVVVCEGVIEYERGRGQEYLEECVKNRQMNVRIRTTASPVLEVNPHRAGCEDWEGCMRTTRNEEFAEGG